MIVTKLLGPGDAAMTLNEVGAKMKCERCGNRPERFYPARQSDAPGCLYHTASEGKRRTTYTGRSTYRRKRTRAAAARPLTFRVC